MPGLSFPEAQFPTSLNKLGKVFTPSDFNETLVKIIGSHDLGQQWFGSFRVGDELRVGEGIGNKVASCRLVGQHASSLYGEQQRHCIIKYRRAALALLLCVEPRAIAGLDSGDSWCNEFEGRALLFERPFESGDQVTTNSVRH